MFRVETNAAELAAAVARYVEAVPQVVRGSLNAWGAMARDAVSQAAPVDTGTMAKAVKSEPIAGTTPGVMLSVGVGYAPHVEFGTKAHEIVAWRAVSLRWPDPTGGWIFRRRVHHPGTRAQPFFFSTIERMLPDLQSLISESLNILVDRCLGAVSR